MEWQKASATTLRVTSPASGPASGPASARRHCRVRRVRMVVAPSRGLQ